MTEIKKAEQVLVLHGQKQNASIIAIKLKNEVVGAARENLERSLEYAYKKRGVVYRSGNIILLIFSPLMTRTFKNEETAIKVALDIDSYLVDHNKKFREKLNYGIGVHIGDVINKIEDNVLKFTSIDKTINLTKKIADISSQEVLLSKDIHVKTINNIKADKVTNTGDLELFRVKRVVNTEQSKKFIEDFMRRN